MSDILASVVAVHGLGGHRLGTWTDKRTGCLWLRDSLPSELPNARIMSYGYDSKLRSRNVLGIMENAEGLLESLKSFRLLVSGGGFSY
jgi:hypothetical protein